MSKFELGEIVWHINRKELVTVVNIRNGKVSVVQAPKDTQLPFASSLPKYQFYTDEKYLRKLTKLGKIIL